MGRVTAGQPILAVQDIESYIPVPKDVSKGRELFALRVVGESMINAGILDRDVVIVRRTNTAQNGDVVVALEQTAGRGQRGNKWDSEPGKNLTLTLVWKPEFLAAIQTLPSMARKKPVFLASSRLRDRKLSQRGTAAGKCAGQPLKASLNLRSSDKAQSRDADADGRRKDGPQRDKAGQKRRSGGEYIVHDEQMPYFVRGYVCGRGDRSGKGARYILSLFFDFHLCLCRCSFASLENVRPHGNAKGFRDG